VTLSPVSPGISAQANALPQWSSSSTSNDRSTGFYSYLHSSSQHDSEETNSDVHPRAVKPHKTEKAGKKADTSQNQGSNDAVVPSPTEPAPQTSPLLALLGLPTAQTRDNDATGKAAHDNGKTVLPLTNAQTKTDTDKPAAKDQNRNADTVIDPAALLVGFAPQIGNAPTAEENSKVDAATAASGASANGASGNDSDLLVAGKSKDTAPVSTAGNLAFALRLSENELKSKFEESLQGVNSAAGTTGVAGEGSSKAAVINAVQAAAGSELKEQSHERDNSFGQNLYEVMQAQQQKATDAPQTAGEQPAPTTATDLEAQQEAAHSEPVRNVHMQVVGDDNNRVDVRLMDRGGELQVSVKSADLNLAKGLQDHMSELTSRLEQGRFQTEVWMPKLGDNAKPEMSGTRDFSSNGNNGSNSSNYSDQQRKGQQQNRPDWVDVLENSTQGTGKTDQTWLQ